MLKREVTANVTDIITSYAEYYSSKTIKEQTTSSQVFTWFLGKRDAHKEKMIYLYTGWRVYIYYIIIKEKDIIIILHEKRNNY